MKHVPPPTRYFLLVGAMSLIGACAPAGSDATAVGQITTKDKVAEGTQAPPSGARAALDVNTRRLRRLSNREYNNVVRDLLGDSSRPADAFIKDSFQNGYDNGSVALAVQSDQAFGYQTAAEAMAASAVGHSMARFLGGCDVGAQGEAACEDAFLASFPKRAYRRPLTDSESQRVRDIFDLGTASGGFAIGLQTALELILQSPQFLYREELGTSDPASVSGTATALSGYEAASELSFLLIGSMPDDQLWSAVEEGRFATVEDRRREGARLLATSGARETLRSFLHQWLG
ncbi:MAG TPA: DUF1595 domain-containing protein, partial [Polyangiaceae bacterium]